MKSPRSSKYQFLFTEIPFDMTPGNQATAEGNFLQFDNSRALYSQQQSEQFIQLNEQVENRIWEVAELVLTEKQKTILNLLKLGATQIEISKKLKVNQSSVLKCLHGSQRKETFRSNKPLFYGGFATKLINNLKKDEQFRNLLFELYKLSEEM